MVALIFSQSCGVVLFLLANRHGLGRTSLATRKIASTTKHAAPGATCNHTDHAALDRVNIAALVAQVDGRLQLDGSALTGHRIDELLAHMRSVADAIVHQRRQSMGQLQDGEVVIALANAQRNRLTRIPLLLGCTLIGITLPLTAGQHAAHFTGQVNASDLAKAQWLHEIVNQVHAHFIGQRVEVHIAGVLNGPHQIHRPQCMAGAEGMATKGP